MTVRHKTSSPPQYIPDRLLTPNRRESTLYVRSFPFCRVIIMTTKRFFLLPLLLLLAAGCEETVNETTIEAYPDPIYTQPVAIDTAVLKARRDELMSGLPAGTMVFITTNELPIRNYDVTYDFRPSSTFYYLTGFSEPNCVAVIRHSATTPGESELVMFVEERTAGEIQWLGSVHGIQGAITTFGADSAYDVDAWTQVVLSYIQSGSVAEIYANFEENDAVNDAFAGIMVVNMPVFSVRALVDEQRFIKSAGEIENIRRAVNISVQAFSEAIVRIKPGRFEYETEAVFDLIFRLNGCTGTAFPSIVASGPNITTLHYDANTRQMASGDLVMIDIGAEYGYYAADVTRTLPVNGTFTHEQAVVYDIVKKAYDAVVAAAGPGVSYGAVFALQRDIIIDEMLAAGIISGTREMIIESNGYRQYILAGLGHSVGLDVHDPWPRESDNNRYFRAGMVFALEPHIYLNWNDVTVAPAYRGVCARIEDDLLITQTGAEVLSATLPSDRATLEAMMRW